jgi:signal transduction histidine kinase
MEVGTLAVKTNEIDFPKLIKEILQEMENIIKQKKIRMVTNIRFDKIVTDREKLKEVLVNLLSNAVKYNREGGLIEISALGYPKESTYIFEVHDTGFGIPKPQQEKIFQKFFRASGKSTENVLGTGLGLFITRMLVEKMGGTISFSSVEGAGSTFSFSIPSLTLNPETKKYETIIPASN